MPASARQLAYLINQYPQASQTFIRREIAAVEAADVRVDRFTVRRWPQKLVDAGDQAEADKTRAVLEGSAISVAARLFTATLATLLTRPAKFFTATRFALALGARAHRRAIHVVYLAEACVLQRWLATANVKHVHAHFGTNSAAVAALVRALGGPPFSFTVHGPEEFDQPRALGLDLKAHAASAVIAVSEFGRSQLYRWLRPEDAPKAHVVRCGVDADYLAAPPTPVPDVPRLVCIGRLAEQKGQGVLIRAAARLRDRGVLLDLMLIGDGPLRPQLEAEIAQLNLTDRVKLAGWMSNAQIRAEILAARATVLPSFAEGLPVVIMESLALGRPVVSTFVAGIPELVQPGISGWLVPAGDEAALADALADVLATDPRLLTEMGAAGAARVREKHDATIESARLLDVLLPEI